MRATVGSLGVDLPPQNPLDDAQWKADQAPGERKRERVRQLVVQSSDRQRPLDDLVQEGLVGVKRLRHQPIRGLLQQTSLGKDGEDGDRNHLAASQARVVSADHCLDPGGDPDSNGLDGSVDDGGHPVLQLRSHDHRHGRAEDTDSRSGKHPCNAEGDGNSLRKLELEGGDDGEPDIEEGNHCLLQLLWVLDSHHGDLGLVVDKLVGAHLLDVSDTILVGIHLVICKMGRSNARGFLIAGLQVVEHVGSAEDQCRLDGGHGGEVGASKEAQPHTKDDLNDVRG
mmetsp:Transcript_42873/g.91955  ORF Transcript_42873/g.91955 Transcript_42873/m.91955 type:complete len:283 (+) Transcript_42873:183-1031(+)